MRERPEGELGVRLPRLGTIVVKNSPIENSKVLNISDMNFFKNGQKKV
jgi:hypothetical protein